MLISQAARKRGNSGRKLPEPWPSLSRVDAQFHRGSLALVAAAPGVGKSAFAMNFALAAQVPTLYISMDTSPGDQVVRIVQNRLEKSRDIAEALLHESRRSNAWQALEKV